MGAVLALATTIALISACGGEDSELTKAEFVERANAVCLQTRERIEAEFTAYGESRAAREAVRAQRADELSAEKANEAAATVAERILIPAMRRQLEELRDVGLPGGDEKRAAALLDALEDGIARAEARPERAARDGTEAFGELRRLADEYGIESC
ncbi:MAG TPA: hypothetical protein VN752_05390 [Solirubrobacterales bacterium]|nr:hypothetical protein [Solirubrobacterales bacterium]